MNGSNRIDNINRLYELLDVLMRTHPRRRLSECSGYDEWPLRGVYFFYENGECRSGSNDDRIVRVGTHALTPGSKKTLWGRLSEHRGNESGGGDHSISVFRLLVGTALLTKNDRQCIGWDINGPRSSGTLIDKSQVEQCVTKTLGNMQILCLPIEDEAGPNSLRGLIERNSIALLSNYSKNKPKLQIDPPSNKWLGHKCTRLKVQESGLWNQHYVGRPYDQKFLDTLDKLVTDL